MITLVIIGVIGALTVPALIQNTQKQEYVSALQKAYSTLSQATQAIMAEEGAPRCDYGGWACAEKNGNKHLYEYYKTHLNVLKDCGTARGCFPQRNAPAGYPNANYTRLHGHPTGDWDGYGGSENRKLILNNGMQIIFVHDSDNCAYSAGGSTELCAHFAVDVNGLKGPNIVGRDVFIFALKNNGLYPMGCDTPDCEETGSAADGCACKVLKEGAMNY